MKRFFVILLAGIMCTVALSQEAKSEDISLNKKTVVFDPGHGGHDKGAKGPNGTLEKSVTLELSKRIATQLNKTYHVILTRSDDYWMDSHARTAAANHAKADLFISIHTGGSFRHQVSKTSIYYYRQFANRNVELGNFQNRPSVERGVQTDWIHIHKRHEPASRSLAELMQHGLNSFTTFSDIEIKGAPLVVLEGADMPAVLIELGYITNPTIETSLKDIGVLSGIVKGIKRGVDVFFESAQHSSIPE